MASIKGKPRKHSILRKIVFMMYLAAVIAVGCFAATMIFHHKRQMEKTLEAHASDLCARISASIAPALQSEDYKTVVRKCIKFARDTENLNYLVITLSNSEHLSLVHTPDGWRTERLSGIWVPEGDASVNTPIIGANALSRSNCLHYTSPCNSHSGILLAWTHVGLSLDAYEASLQDVYRTTGLVGIGVLLLCTITSLSFARRITRPLAQLQTYAQKVAAGAIGSRVQINTNDEISDLADSINSMITTLEESNVKVKQSARQSSALREKDILLREIHHRVKNNMQILSSMIRLQSRQTENPEVLSVLNESEARIRSMGLLHEKLYKSEAIAEIDFHDYVLSLTNELVRMNSQAGARVQVQLSIAGVMLGLDTALPCGLIITELVCNCLKYAFPNGQAGTILISLSKTSSDEYSLVVWDNGVGIPQDFNPATSNSLGTRLVLMLCEQLNGNISIDNQGGTRTEIRFKESHYQNRY